MKKYSKTLVLIPFVIFFTLILRQYLLVYMYYDDYGFASLSYSYTLEGINGTDYNLFQLIQFLYHYYINWGGRVLSFGIEALMLKESVLVMQVFMAVVVTGTMYFSYKLMTVEKEVSLFEKIFRAISICGLFGLLHIGLLRDSYYWYTSAVIYVMPFLAYTMAVYFYRLNMFDDNKIVKNKYFNIAFKIFTALLFFIASFSQEQIAISMIVIVASLIIIKYIISKKISKWDVINLAFVLLGTIGVVFAKGNYQRMDEHNFFYNTPVLERTISNIDSVFYEILGTKFIYLMEAYIMSIILLVIVKLIKNYGNRIVNTIFLFINLFIAYEMIFEEKKIYSLVENFTSEKIRIVVLMIYIIFLSYEILEYFFIEKRYIISMIYIASLCTIGSLAFIPTITVRCYTPFTILSFIIITESAASILEVMKDNRIKYIFSIIILFLLCSFSYNNYSLVYDGYLQNEESNKYNDKILREISLDKDIKKVKLKKLPNEICANILPYTEGNKYVEVWMKEYYDIGKKVKFKWE